MLIMFVNVLLFALEIIVCVALVFYILKADKWALNMKQTIETESKKTVSSIKELKINLKKINAILKHIKDFKHSLIRKIIAQTLDAMSILQLLTTEKQSIKTWKSVGIKVIKGFLLGFKMMLE